MNYYRHHIGDFDADTAHLSWMEDAAYRRLICLYYRREQPIPADIAQACRLVRAVSKPEREAVETVLREFFTLTDDGWRNKRCEEEIDASRSKADANRSNGVKGGRPRKPATHEKPTGFLEGTDAEPTNNLSQEPLANSQEPGKDLAPSVLVGNAVADPPDGRAYAVPDCPVAEVVERYHLRCPTLNRVEIVNEFRRGLVRSRWREVCAEERFDRAQALEWWDDFFAFVNRSPFLTGRTAGKPGSPPFKADFEWLVRPQNFVRVVENRYHREAA